MIRGRKAAPDATTQVICRDNVLRPKTPTRVLGELASGRLSDSGMVIAATRIDIDYVAGELGKLVSLLAHESE